VYLHRGAPFLSLGRSLNGTFLVTPVYLHRGATSFALGNYYCRQQSNGDLTALPPDDDDNDDELVLNVLRCQLTY